MNAKSGNKIKNLNFKNIIVVILFVLSLINIVLVIKNNNQAIMAIPGKLSFSGEYSYDDKTWYELTSDSNISAMNGNIRIRGHFDREITEGTLLNIFCNHIGISMYVNGELRYIDAQSEIHNLGYKLMPSMCGRRWDRIYCTDINENDEVEFVFMNFHEYGNEKAYREAISDIYTTLAEVDILENYLQNYIRPFKIIGFALLIIAVMLLGASVSALILKSSIKHDFFVIGVATLFTGLYIAFDVMIINLMNELLVVRTYGMQICMMIAVYFVQLMACSSFSGVKKKIADVCMVLSGIMNCVIMYVVASEKLLMYDTLKYWNLQQIVLCTVFIVLCICNIVEKKKKHLLQQIVFIINFLAIILDSAGVTYTTYNTRTLYKITFLILLAYYFINGINVTIMEHQASIKNKKLQKELENSRIAVMLSQIQPHFLYNIIGTIRGLCRIDSEQAWKALGDFSNYLRGNMDALSNSDMIHFSNELKHIQAYLQLEKMRMGDELNVIYDIQENNFFLPPLTIQPIVENAVKHGLFNKDGGGTVTLHTRRENDNIIIEVTDDGVGFDPDAPYEYDVHHAHIGLINVKSRLEKMLKGEMIINSAVNEGTTVKIIIKK